MDRQYYATYFTITVIKLQCVTRPSLNATLMNDTSSHVAHLGELCCDFLSTLMIFDLGTGSKSHSEIKVALERNIIPITKSQL